MHGSDGVAQRIIWILTRWMAGHRVSPDRIIVAAAGKFGLPRSTVSADRGSRNAQGDLRPGAEGSIAARTALNVVAPIEALVYELLDAHNDTAQLAKGLDVDACWQAHLDYLRSLQRKGREILAHAAESDPRQPRG
jgi:hypothetical protein